MKISRYRSSNVMVIGIIAIIVGIVSGIAIGFLSGVEVNSSFYFNWQNAFIILVPLLSAGMILLGLAQLTSLGEEIEAKINKNQEDDEE